MHRSLEITLGIAVLSLAFAAVAQKPIAYPAKQQSSSQQATDDSECQAWSKQSTGIDPARPSAAPVAAPPPPRGGVARGAMAGAAVGAIGDTDVGNAAAKGAIVGAVAQRSRARGQQEATAAQAQQAQGQQQQDLSTYYRAYGACMTGRGYTVN